MAITYLSYQSIPEGRRRSSGQRILSQLRDSLRNPALTQEQRDSIQAEIQRINAWIKGVL